MSNVFINVEYHEGHDGGKSVNATRLWPAILKFTKRTLHQPIEGSIWDGFGITVINNLAIVVEGFVTDVLFANDQRQHFKNAILSEKTWEPKKNRWAKKFRKRLEDYNEYAYIDALFILRNNTAHGLTHREISSPNAENDTAEAVKSENDNYEKVRLFFINQGLMDNKAVWTNVNVFWSPEIITRIIFIVKQFLYSIASEIELDSIKTELDLACGRK